MTTLLTFAEYEIGFLLAAFMAVVAFQLLTGRINTRGLICEKTRAGSGGVSAGRVQLLLFTLAFALYVLSEVMKSHQFPDIETKWLLLLGGSHSIYLSGKGVLSLLGLQSSQEGEPQ